MTTSIIWPKRPSYASNYSRPNCASNRGHASWPPVGHGAPEWHGRVVLHPPARPACVATVIASHGSLPGDGIRADCPLGLTAGLSLIPSGSLLAGCHVGEELGLYWAVSVRLHVRDQYVGKSSPWESGRQPRHPQRGMNIAAMQPVAGSPGGPWSCIGSRSPQVVAHAT